MKEPQENPKILFAIVTCQKNLNKQQVLRETWLQDIPEGVDWVFVQDREKNEMNLQEHELALATQKGYEHLARKSYDLFSYLAKESNYDYVVKIDDDAYVEPQNVVDFIKGKSPDYAGRRNIQYHESGVIPYAQGGFYVLSRESVQKIANYTFEDGEGSPWWYGGQKNNKAWKGATDEMKAAASTEDLMVGQILLESGTKFKVAFGSFDFYKRFNNTSLGNWCIRKFLRICSEQILSFHPVGGENMKRYYALSQEARNQKGGIVRYLVSRALALGLFGLEVFIAYLIMPLYIWRKNK